MKTLFELSPDFNQSGDGSMLSVNESHEHVCTFNNFFRSMYLIESLLSDISFKNCILIVSLSTTTSPPFQLNAVFVLQFNFKA